MSLPPQVVAASYYLPWLLFRREQWTLEMVHDPCALESFDEKVEAVWDELLALKNQHPEFHNLEGVTVRLLGQRIFSPIAEQRDNSVRMAFEACLHPQYRPTVMAEGTSTQVWYDTHLDYARLSKQGDPLGDAFTNMLDVLKRQSNRLRMARAGVEPAILWEDLLQAADAPNNANADRLLIKFTEDEFTTWLGNQPYILVNALVLAVPRVVELSRNPQPNTRG